MPVQFALLDLQQFMTPEPDETLLQVLRQATSQTHRELEQTEVLSPLLQADLTQAHYVQVLSMFARFYATVDAHLVLLQPTLNKHVPGYRYQPRLPYLHQDLFALDAPLPTQPCAINAPTTLQNAVGWCYVVEGSSQGGAIINRRLQQTLALTPHYGLSFFHHFSVEHDGWNILKHWLSRQSTVNRATQPKLYCEGANQLFSALTNLAKEPSSL